MSDRVLILGIDTSGDGELALAELHADGSLDLLAKETLDPRRQSAELLSKLSLLFGAASQAGLAHSASAGVASLSAIVIVNGPGSFTGLRIGISAAKGLADAADIPMIAVSSLATFTGAAEKDTVALLAAGREFYVRLPDGTESLETEATLGDAIGEKRVVIGDGKLAARFPSALIGIPGAYQAILTALPRYLAGDFDDVATLDANYVRRPYTDLAEVKVAP